MCSRRELTDRCRVSHGSADALDAPRKLQSARAPHPPPVGDRTPRPRLSARGSGVPTSGRALRARQPAPGFRGTRGELGRAPSSGHGPNRPAELRESLSIARRTIAHRLGGCERRRSNPERRRGPPKVRGAPQGRWRTGRDDVPTPSSSARSCLWPSAVLRAWRVRAPIDHECRMRRAGVLVQTNRLSTAKML